MVESLVDLAHVVGSRWRGTAGAPRRLLGGFLRVPQAVRTAREAVAWTFGFDDPNDYLLAAES